MTSKTNHNTEKLRCLFDMQWQMVINLTLKDKTLCSNEIFIEIQVVSINFLPNKPKYRVNLLKSASILNIVSVPQSGPSLYTGARGCVVAHQFIMGPKAAKRPINLKCGQRPQSDSSLCREAYIRYLVMIRSLLNLPYIPTSKSHSGNITESIEVLSHWKNINILRCFT